GGGRSGFLHITNLPFTPHFIYAMHVSAGAHNFFIACDGNYGGLPKFQIRYVDEGTIYSYATKINGFIDEYTEYYKGGERVHIGFQSNYIALFTGSDSYKYIILG
ncbi:MAG TPA: hypothetical protein GX697_01200, partial [Firmicutes bacterium]|nr:hypothetical protein [Bacillota bacterium]